jgi:hypothetical protein
MVQHMTGGPVRTTLTLRLTLILSGLLVTPHLTAPAAAQTALETGTPQAAFLGGPIKLSKTQVGMLRTHFQGDKVPLIPQPFRGKLDTALVTRDWPRVEAVKKQLVASRGIITALMWEQSRFIATGGIGIAELHAQDIAATGSTGVSETAAMLWLYAVAVTMTDGHKCADDAMREAHLDRLRGPEFAPVTRIVRAMADDRLAAMRDLAIRLESILAVERDDDTMCRSGTAKPEVKPDNIWRPAAAGTRATLARQLVAICAVVRSAPIATAGAGKPERTAPEKLAVAKPEARKAEAVKAEPGKAEPAKAETTGTENPGTAKPEPGTPKPEGATAEPAKPAPTSADPAKAETVNAEAPKPAIANPETAKLEKGNADPAKPAIINADPAKTETVNAAPATSTSSTGEPAKAEAANVEPAKPSLLNGEPTKPETPGARVATPAPANAAPEPKP